MLFRVSKQSASAPSRSSLEFAAAAAAAAGFGAASGAVDDAAAVAFGINRTDLRIIGALHRDGPLTAGRIAEASGLSPAATTTAIQRLVTAGHATREVDAFDRRRVVVSVTTTAARLLETIYGPVAEAGMSVLDRYGTADLALLGDFLRRGEAVQRDQATRIGRLRPAR
jgi:DNA-binding MarR family transcriptional regulator